MMKYLTRGEKQEIILKMLLIKHPKATIAMALDELNFYHKLRGNILDIKG